MGKFDNYMTGSGGTKGGMPGPRDVGDYSRDYPSGYGGRTRWICSDCGEGSIHYHEIYLEHRKCKKCGGKLIRPSKS